MAVALPSNLAHRIFQSDKRSFNEGAKFVLSEYLSLVFALGGVIVIIMLQLRRRYITSLASDAICGSAFGLFIASRYAQADHSVGAIFFAVGVAFLMCVVAVRHFKAYPPTL